MAKATANCTCKECGKRFEKVKILRNCKEAESWQKWAEAHIDICPECDERNAIAATEAKIAQLRDMYGAQPMIGSAKQIAWAEQIQLKVVTYVKKNIDAALAISQRELDLGKITEDVHKERVETNDGYIRYLYTETNASWWIDRRFKMEHEVCRELMARMIEEQKQAEASKQEHEESPNEDAADVDDTTSYSADEPVEKEYIAGPEHPSKDGIVTISGNGQHVEFRYVRDDTFIRLMHDHRCTWSGSVWYKQVCETTPGAADIAAEIGADLINNGFVVKFESQEILDKAISGNYETEHHRWVHKMAKEYDGWFGIVWSGRDDNLYQAARHIKGSKYSRPYVLVPSDRWKEVTDFARQHDFRLTHGAQAIVDTQQALIDSRITTAPISPKPIKSKLEQSGVILEDLRDE